MVILLALNILFLIVAGLIMILKPTIFFPRGDSLALANANAIGFADLSFTIVSAMLLMNSSQYNKPAIVGLFVYHLGVVLTQIINRKSDAFQLPPLILHAGFSLAFLVVLLTH